MPLNAPELHPEVDSRPSGIGQQRTVRPNGSGRATKALLFCFLGSLLLFGAAWIFRAPLLSAAGRSLIVDDPLPDKADAVIVLGGGISHRPLEAARLYNLGVAKHVLVAYPAIDTEAAAAPPPSEGDAATAMVRQAGVPDSSISPLGFDVKSTHDEAQAALQWVTAHPCRRLIVPTDLLHTRRVKWSFEQVLRGTGVEVTVTAIYNKRYTAENWWHWPDGKWMFQAEIVKLLLYRVLYH